MALPITPPPVAAAAAEAAASAAPAEPMGDLFRDYNPEGSLGGMFAPAFIKGFQPSEQAVQAWTAKNRPISYSDVDELRMPNAWQPPQQTQGWGDVYGSGRIPNNLKYGDERGEVDPLALLSLSQGGPYDKEARRNAIAKRLADNTAAQTAYNKPQQAPFYDFSGMYEL